MDNKLVDLLAEGLSWRDSLDASEQARLLNQGRVDLWKKEILKSAKTIGISKVLQQIAFSYKELSAWGTYLHAVLSLFDLDELYGLALEPAEFVKHVAATAPKSWSAAKKTARSRAIEHLKKQIEAGDAYLLRPSVIKSPDLSVFVPPIIEIRRRHIEEVCPYLMDDGLIDLFDFLELPLAMDFMIKSGVGGRANPTEAKVVLDKLVELEIITTASIEKKREGRTPQQIDERYLRLYTDCIPTQRDLLRGAAMALDPDEEVSGKGIDLIYSTGHIHVKEPLLNALERTNDSILVNAIRGLGILGEKDTIPMIGQFLSGSSNEIQSAVCIALGRLQSGNHVGELSNMLRNSDEQVRLAAAGALLQIKTEKAQEEFWKNYQRFGNIKLIAFTKDIGNLKSERAILFMIDLLLLDLQSFLHSGEIQMYNALLNAREGPEHAMMMLLVQRLREQAVSGFGAMGSDAVPVLASLLRIFPETSKIVWRDVEWEDEEVHIADMLERRLQEHFRHFNFPRPEHIPNPVNEAIRALGVTHSERAVPYLEELAMADSEELALVALEALSEIDTPALDVLIRVPESNPAIQMKKVRDIGTIVHPKATEWLIKQSESKNPLVRMETTNFLAMRNDASLSKHLQKMANDPEAIVRVGLANVIARLGMNTYPEVMRILSEDKEPVVRDTIVRARLHFEADEQDEFWA